MLTNLQTRVIFNGIDLSGCLAYLAIGVCILYWGLRYCLDFPPIFWYDCSEKEKHMTMTKDILEAAYWPEHSGGRTEVSIQAIREIVKKHDPEGFESFNPFEELE